MIRLEEYDILIKNGLIVDGTGIPPRKGSVAIKGERIAAIGEIPRADSKVTIDATGLIISPGFIDVHSHADKTLPLFPTADNYVMQGITTTVGGNCGNTIAPIYEWWPPNMFWDSDIIFELRPYKYYSEELLPADEVKKKVREIYNVEIDWGSFRDFVEWLSKNGISVNHVPLVGHNTIRAQVLGPRLKSKPTNEEIEKMKFYVEEAMKAGAFGLSSGLDYIPGAYAPTEELIELTKVVKKYGGIYATHWRATGIRRERRTRAEKIKGIIEAIEIGRKAGVQVQISHITSGYTIIPPPPKELAEAAVKSTLKVIDEAKGEGLKIAFDVIPNVTGGTLTNIYLASLLAPWLRVVGSRAGLAHALRMNDFREEIRSEILQGKWWGLNPIINPYWSNVIEIISCKEKNYVGKTISEIAMERGIDDLEALFNVLMADPDTIIRNKGYITEYEVSTFLKHPDCMIGLDTYTFDDKWMMLHPPYMLPHPNTYGGMPRYIRKYIRETKILTLEEGIRKITGLPAKIFKLKNRGILKVGAYADVVVFNFNEISDVEYLLGNKRYPKGIVLVIVNGKIVVKNGKHTRVKPGKVLKFSEVKNNKS